MRRSCCCCKQSSALFVERTCADIQNVCGILKPGDEFDCVINIKKLSLVTDKRDESKAPLKIAQDFTMQHNWKAANKVLN